MLALRRIVEDLRELRWPEVFLELVLLVLGILLALAVNNWMEDRRDVRAERRYLELLVRDLDWDLRALQDLVALEQAQAKDGVMAYRALARRTDVSDKEAVSAALSRLTNARTLRLTRVTYSDLVTTGNIRLIRNPILRDRLVKLYEDNARLLTVLDYNNQAYVHGMYAMYLIDTALVAPRASSNMSDIAATMKQLGADLGPPADVRDDRLWQLAADAPEWQVLRGKVWRRALVSVLTVRRLQVAAEQVATVREEIARELSRRWPDADRAQEGG